MTSRREFTPQTLSVLAALHEQPSQWQHGYALASETGLKSGTLYPILIRLADQGLVEARWQEEPVPGRPRRHMYRLTADGVARATQALTSATEALAAQAAQQPSRRPAPAPGTMRPGRRSTPSRRSTPGMPGAVAPVVR